ncbi:uncharacterized protein LOC132612786 [Lycium barbarum]|uniref:uncharacterized protein LOC132612786 n=1 Tax=Lycium barbarum TaxID=112863 RepID=UPI00293EB90E|nr:uncharacterized protein LOC132612786 [Lycium barbarum]
MDFSREELYTVPIWIKLPGLDFKYWSPKGLSKIGSLIGKPLMVDKNTERKIDLNFDRLMVEVGMDSILPDTVTFINERGCLIEQKVSYEWKPTLCKLCKKYGHSEDVCRKKVAPKPVQHIEHIEDEERIVRAAGGKQAGGQQDRKAKQTQTVGTGAQPRNGANTANVAIGKPVGAVKETAPAREQKANDPQGNVIDKSKAISAVNVAWVTPMRGSTTQQQMKDQLKMEEARPFLLVGMASLLSWNVRGLNGPNKQKEVKLLYIEERVGLIGLLETKIKKDKIQQVANNMFGGWNHINNLDYHYNGRIWITWRPDFYQGESCLWAEVVDFATCVDECGLIELPHQGNQYTWSDKGSTERIYSKIDWVFINDEWLNSMPSSRTIFLPEGVSDHCPAKVNLIEGRSRQQRSFLYCNVRGQHPQFLQLVKVGWEIPIQGCKMLQVVKRLKLLKRELKKLNSQNFRNLVQEADTDRADLRLAQSQLQLNPQNQDLQKQERDTYAKFKQSSYLAELYLQQQSKVTWLRLGDDNTRHFHSVIKHRRLKQITTQLRDDHGDLQSDPDAIAKNFLNYYEELLGRRVNNRVQAKEFIWKNGLVLSSDQKLKLIQPFTENDRCSRGYVQD